MKMTIQKQVVFMCFALLILVAYKNEADRNIMSESENVSTEAVILETTVEATIAPVITQDATATNALILRGEYMGQEPPGIIPELFAPGFISTEDAFEFSTTFSPDGTEFYFTRRELNGDNVILFTELKDEQWTIPIAAPFNSDYIGAEAIMSPDGEQMFFFARRPLPEQANPNAQSHIWITERTESGWTEPEFFGSDMMYITTAMSGSIYYTDVSLRGIQYLATMSFSINGYSEQNRVDLPTRWSFDAAHPFVAPDESYLIFNSVPADTNEEKDLYVIFKQEDGNWSNPANLGDKINTDQEEFAAMVSPDGKYLFFCRNGDIYWVSADIIETLKPD